MTGYSYRIQVIWNIYQIILRIQTLRWEERDKAMCKMYKNFTLSLLIDRNLYNQYNIDIKCFIYFIQKQINIW